MHCLCTTALDILCNSGLSLTAHDCNSVFHIKFLSGLLVCFWTVFITDCQLCLSVLHNSVWELYHVEQQSLLLYCYMSAVQ